MDSLTVKLVRDADGVVDETATLSAAREAIARHVAQREVELSTILSAIQAVCDEKAGVHMNMPYVVNQALTKLNAQPENMSTLKERVETTIRANASTKREDGKLFRVLRGKPPAGIQTGTFARWSDVPESEQLKSK